MKDDSVNHPTFSYKDRVVSVAISKALEFGFDTFGCASTGNLANSVAANATAILEQSERMTRLIRQLLDFARRRPAFVRSEVKTVRESR